MIASLFPNPISPRSGEIGFGKREDRAWGAVYPGRQSLRSFALGYYHAAPAGAPEGFLPTEPRGSPQLLRSNVWAIVPLSVRGPTTVFTHRRLSPHQFTPMSGAHHSVERTGGGCEPFANPAALGRRHRSLFSFGKSLCQHLAKDARARSTLLPDGFSFPRFVFQAKWRLHETDLSQHTLDPSGRLCGAIADWRNGIAVHGAGN